MGVKMGWMGHLLAQNGAALTPFCANGAHPSYITCICIGYTLKVRWLSDLFNRVPKACTR